MRCLCCSFGQNQKVNIAGIIMTMTMTDRKIRYMPPPLVCCIFDLILFSTMMLYSNAGTKAKSEPRFNGSELMAENCPKKPENIKAVLKYVILGSMKAVFIFVKPHTMKMRKVAKLLPMLKFCEIEKKKSSKQCCVVNFQQLFPPTYA